MTGLLLLAIFGAIGSLIRFHLGGFVHSSVNKALASETEFPFGTLFVNIAGSFLLGFLAGVAVFRSLDPLVMTVLGAGLCGSLTTFSTLAVDLQRFLRDRRFVHAAMNLFLTLAAGLGAAWAGFVLARP